VNGAVEKTKKLRWILRGLGFKNSIYRTEQNTVRKEQGVLLGPEEVRQSDLGSGKKTCRLLLRID